MDITSNHSRLRRSTQTPRSVCIGFLAWFPLTVMATSLPMEWPFRFSRLLPVLDFPSKGSNHQRVHPRRLRLARRIGGSTPRCDSMADQVGPPRRINRAIADRLV